MLVRHLEPDWPLHRLKLRPFGNELAAVARKPAPHPRHPHINPANLTGAAVVLGRYMERLGLATLLPGDGHSHSSDHVSYAIGRLHSNVTDCISRLFLLGYAVSTICR